MRVPSKTTSPCWQIFFPQDVCRPCRSASNARRLRRRVAGVLWVAGLAALSCYLSNFADYNATYGSLGAAIGLMMWMWLSTIVVLLGAQLDIVIERKLPAAH